MSPTPIPLTEAIQAVRVALKMIAVAPEVWYPTEDRAKESTQFVFLSRAALKPALEYVLRRLSDEYAQNLRDGDTPWMCDTDQVAAVAPLIAHLEAHRPGWREEKL